MAYHTIDEFMSKIGRHKGMSLTTGFDVFFEFNSVSDAETLPLKYYTDGDQDVVHMMCDEAQLPNVQSATGQLSGRYLGESALQYPHSRMFTDVGLGFFVMQICYQQNSLIIGIILFTVKVNQW